MLKKHQNVRKALPKRQQFHTKISPKKSPIYWANFSRKKVASGKKKSPKWRNFAQSGHTLTKISWEGGRGGSIPQWLAFLLPDPVAPGLIPGIPEILSDEKIVDYVEVNQQWCLEERGQWLDNVGWTYLVLVNGKLVTKNPLPSLNPFDFSEPFDKGEQSTARAPPNLVAQVGGFLSLANSRLLL